MMHAFRFAALLSLPFLLGAQVSKPDAAGIELFEKKIRPVLVARCYPCHSESSPKVQGALWLDSREGMRKGGNSGSPIVAGDPDASLLIRALRHSEETLKMPPGKPLKPEIVADFERWVKLGAPDPRTPKTKAALDLVPAKAREFWSFKKPVMPPIPPVADAGWVRTPVDNFILSKLQQSNLTPSPAAEKRTLLRRAAYDLIGLPPTLQEIADFVKDTSPNAFEKVVDRLLASPQYGERWGRHWLDVARYADTRDRGSRFAFSYTYRDWVIRALNEDMPYNDFVRKQVAADRMELKDRRDLAALGFITLGRSVPKGEHDMIDDRIDAITRGLQGLTVTCARCHDHKFDPIPTRDYYSFYGMIANSEEPVEHPLIAKEDDSPLVREYREGMKKRLQAIEDFKMKRHAELVAEFRTAPWLQRYLLAAQQASKMSNTELEKLSRDRDYNLFVLRRWRDYLNRTREQRDPVFAAWHAFSAQAPAGLRTLPANANPEVVKALTAKPPASLDDVATVYSELLAKFDGEAPRDNAAAEAIRLVLRGENTPTNIELAHFMKIRGAGGDDNIIRGLTDAVRAWQAECSYRGLPPRAMALEDAAYPKLAHVFVRGNPNNLGMEAPAHFLSVLSKDPKPFTNGSGRLELANAIAGEENPLTARVIVNRVWGWHFGRGIVATPSDFGIRGDLPTHPELLDYLAKRFMEEGWSLKKLHKWIMLSNTYRQSSIDRPQARSIDPENKLLWRMNRQRLDFESLRDSTLFAAGQLDFTMGGLPYSLTAIPAVPRRTVYAYVERGHLPGELNAFDFANPEAHIPLRYQTTVPQQALYLMNSPFFAQESKHLMARPEIQKASDNRARIESLYRIVFGRDPSKDELTLALGYVTSEPDSKAAEDMDTQQSVWQYGMGAFDEKTGRVEFEPFTYFADDKWQPASLLPQPILGSPYVGVKAALPGDDPKHAVIRRWVAPVDGTVEITGNLVHKLDKENKRKEGDGVRARIVHGARGKLVEQIIEDKSVEMTVHGVAVRKGDTIDFLVDCIGNSEADLFTWIPEVQMKEGETWNAAKGFHGPRPIALNGWEKYAQVLFETNEFAFVD